MYQPKLLMKIGTMDEFEIGEKVPGVTFLSEDSTPQFTNTYQDINGLDGSPFAYETLGKSTINVRLWLQFSDYADFKLAKHEIYRLFGSRRLIRLRTNTDPAKVFFVYPTPFDITIAKTGDHDVEFTIPFENPSGYRYSLFRSDTPYTFSQEGWQVGMNLLTDDVPTYQFKTKKFKVYNASDIKIDPYYQKHDLKITSKFTGDSLKIANHTTDTEWEYKKSSNGKEVITLNGIYAYRDNVSCAKDTDFGNISLETGYNDIEVTGATTVDVTFSFPFIYLS